MVSFRSAGVDRIDRRSFVSLLGTWSGALALSGSADTGAAETGTSDDLEALSLYSTASHT